MRFQSLALLALLVSACTPNVAVRGDRQGLSPRAGGVVFGFYKAETRPPLLWTLTIGRVNEANGTIATSTSTTGLPAFIRHSEIGYQSERSDIAFYNLAPGTYAVAAIVPFEAQAQFHQPTTGEDVRNATITHGFLGAGMTGLMIAGEQVREAREAAVLGPRRPSELIFVENDRIKDDAPRFTVQAGRVTYIGDFLLGARRYKVEMKGIGGGIAHVEGENNEIAYWHSPAAEHSYDEPRVRARLAEIGIPSSIVTTQRLTRLDGGRLYYDPNFDRTRAELRAKNHGKQTILEEDVMMPTSLGAPAASSRSPTATTGSRNSAPAATAPPAASAPLSSLPAAELRRRFLAGEISMEEYNKARAGQ